MGTTTTPSTAPPAAPASRRPAASSSPSTARPSAAPDLRNPRPTAQTAATPIERGGQRRQAQATGAWMRKRSAGQFSQQFVRRIRRSPPRGDRHGSSGKAPGSGGTKAPTGGAIGHIKFVRIRRSPHVATDTVRPELRVPGDASKARQRRRHHHPRPEGAALTEGSLPTASSSPP